MQSVIEEEKIKEKRKEICQEIWSVKHKLTVPCVQLTSDLRFERKSGSPHLRSPVFPHSLHFETNVLYPSLYPHLSLYRSSAHVLRLSYDHDIYPDLFLFLYHVHVRTHVPSILTAV